jgi:hypothetical protein
VLLPDLPIRHWLIVTQPDALKAAGGSLSRRTETSLPDQFMQEARASLPGSSTGNSRDVFSAASPKLPSAEMTFDRRSTTNGYRVPMDFAT